MSLLRAILALSRPWALPTVWSNCLAGWWLGGGGNPGEFALVLAGATSLCLGGVFLNDAFDADYDQQHRRTRPIPVGAFSHDTVWRWGLGALVAGALLLLWPGRVTGSLGLVLACCIILYNALHRLLTFSPVLLGICRLLLYLLGASAAERGVTGWAIWCGLALAVYVTGLGFFARWQRLPGPAPYWPTFLLAAPILLALVMDVDGFREPGLLLSAVLGLWTLRSLRPAFWSPERDLSRTVSDLAAGIVFADWLAACPVGLFAGQDLAGPRAVSFIFLALFLATLGFQRLTPTR
jgi:hypothetical protein